MNDNNNVPTGIPPQARGNTPNPSPIKLYLPGDEPSTPRLYEEDTIAFNALTPPPSSVPTTVVSGNLPPTQPVSSHMDRTALMSGPGAYGPYNPTGGRGQYFKAGWWIASIAGMALIAVVLSMVLPALPFFAAPGGKSTAQSTQVASTPVIPTATPAPSPTPALIFASGVSVTPDAFNVRNDCDNNDNGYSCTATLSASSDESGNVDWSVSSNLQTDFNPSGGTLAPGQDQQVIINIYNNCSYKGNIKFMINGTEKVLTLPVTCQRHHRNNN